MCKNNYAHNSIRFLNDIKKNARENVSFYESFLTEENNCGRDLSQPTTIETIFPPIGEMPNDFTKDFKNSRGIPFAIIREIIVSRLRFERKKGSNNETVTQSPLQPSIAPLFPPSCLVNRIKRGPLVPSPPSLFPFSGKERRVGGEAFRSRAFAFASGWRTVKNKDPFVRIGVERGGLRLVSKGEKVFRRERERRKRRQCNGRKKPCGRRMGWKGSSFMETRQCE